MKATFFKGLMAVFIGLAVATPAQAEWLEAKSAHFTVIGNMSETDLRRRTDRLERYDAMLRFLLRADQTAPVKVYIVSSMGAVQDFANVGGGIVGFYNASAQRAFAVVPERFDFYVEDFNPRVVLLHEYAHHMLLSNVGLFMPSWAQEGLAEMFATARFEDDGSVLVGDMNDARAVDMLEMGRWRVERMLQSDFVPPSMDELYAKYARGLLTVHYLWMSGERPNQYVDFIAELNRTVDPEASGKKVFGDLKKLDRELDHYLNMRKFKLSRLTPALIGTIGPITVRPLGKDEVAILNYHIASSVGVSEKTAGPLAAKARPVGAQYPDSVAVQTAIAEMEYDAKNYDESWAAAERALARDPTNLFALVYKGRVAMRRAIAAKDPALAKEARGWFLKANRADPEHALPFALYYDSFGAMGEAPPADAVAGLYRALELVPQDPELRIRAAIALLREGNVGRARSVIAPAAFAAEGAGENPPLKLVKKMIETQDRDTLLAAVAELKLDQVNEFIERKEEKADKKGA